MKKKKHDQIDEKMDIKEICIEEIEFIIMLGLLTLFKFFSCKLYCASVCHQVEKQVISFDMIFLLMILLIHILDK